MAQNQALFREVNERIKPLNEAFSFVSRLNDFVCECPVETCTAPIPMSVEEYESVRARADRFAVAPSDEHVGQGVERVVEKHDRYWVVEKVGRGREVAEHLDPRSRQSR
jgi:hypothetical protein